MGIPAYMSYIIKNYSNIINNIQYHKNNNMIFDCLYMDCNSIIYDVFNNILKEDKYYENIEEIIIQRVVEQIEKYILYVNPRDTLFITFDGVAPFSKMEQQRLRRYKTWHMSTFNITEEKKKVIWSTSSITPGTEFMNKLSKTINLVFKNNEEKYKLKKIIVSCSDEVGEGEQKIFKYIRNNSHIEKNICVYGLDSDLIMLSIFHCIQCGNIFVFREEPEFIKSKINTGTNTKNVQTLPTSFPEFSVSAPSATPPILQKNINELLFLDISILSESILNEMTNNKNDKNRIYDYLLLCFFLGNDFLPHFPSLNIRTNGIQILIETYKLVIGKYNDRYFISKNGKIQWKWLKKFIEKLSNNEKHMFLNEYNLREKMDYYKWQQTTKEEKELVLHNTPIIYRAEEKYICPTEKMWEERYYKILFDIERTEDNIKKISNNFLEGIEWVFKYYTHDCPDWKWKYHYNYPPLFIDMLKFIPDVEKDFISLKLKSNIPFTPQLQLSYVLPEVNHYLLNEKNKDYLKKNYSCLFPEKIVYIWAFCRYFFESHIILPEISINVLENLEKELLLL